MVLDHIKSKGTRPAAASVSAETLVVPPARKSGGSQPRPGHRDLAPLSSQLRTRRPPVKRPPNLRINLRLRISLRLPTNLRAMKGTRPCWSPSSSRRPPSSMRRLRGRGCGPCRSGSADGSPRRSGSRGGSLRPGGARGGSRPLLRGCRGSRGSGGEEGFHSGVSAPSDPRPPRTCGHAWVWGRIWSRVRSDCGLSGTSSRSRRHVAARPSLPDQPLGLHRPGWRRVDGSRNASARFRPSRRRTGPRGTGLSAAAGPRQEADACALPPLWRPPPSSPPW